MPEQHTWTRDGRTLLASGQNALYLDLCRHPFNGPLLAPYQADCVAIQLFNALQRGVIQVPTTVGEYDRLAQLPPVSVPEPLSLAAALPVFVRALEAATPPEMRAARTRARAASQDMSLPASERFLYTFFASMLTEVLK